MFSAGARASTRRFLLLGGGGLLSESVVVVCRAAAWLRNPAAGVSGAGRLRAATGAAEGQFRRRRRGRGASLEGLARDPRLPAVQRRVAVQSSRCVLTGQRLLPPRRTGSNRRQWARRADRIQGVCSVCDIMALNTQALRSDPAAHRIDQSPPEKSESRGFFWASATPRCARRQASEYPSSPGRRPSKLRFLQAARPSRAHATETRHSIVRPRAEGDAGVAVTRVSTHHTEAIRSRCHLIYRKACPASR